MTYSFLSPTTRPFLPGYNRTEIKYAKLSDPSIFFKELVITSLTTARDFSASCPGL